jgi:hypothetical protein
MAEMQARETPVHGDVGDAGQRYEFMHRDERGGYRNGYHGTAYSADAGDETADKPYAEHKKKLNSRHLTLFFGCYQTVFQRSAILIFSKSCSTLRSA